MSPRLAALLAVLAACSKAPEPPKLDRTDARSVALAFLAAAARGDREEAASYFRGEERERFRKEFGEAPPIPAAPDLSVSEKVIDGVRRADVDVRNAKGLGLDMVFENGSWWITR